MTNSAFHLADKSAIHIGSQGKCFLRNIAGTALAPQRSAELDCDLIAFPHNGKVQFIEAVGPRDISYNCELSA